MGIYKRGKGYRVEVMRNGQRKTGQAYTEDQAKILEGELLAQLTAQQDATGWTLKQAYERCLSTVWRAAKSRRTSELNSGFLLRFFGEDTHMDDIDAEWIHAFVEERRKQGDSDSTINRKLSALSKIFKEAVRFGGAKARPYIPHFKESEGRIRWITEDEEAQMLSLCELWGQQDLADFIQVAIDTGLRVGTNLLKLEGRDANLQDRLIVVWESKAKVRGSVPMTSRVVSILAARKATLKDGRLFPYTMSWLHSRWNRMRSAMGLDGDPQFIPHAMRHTCASRLAMAGVPLQVVREWLLHKRIEQTMKYAHLCPLNLQRWCSWFEDGGHLGKSGGHPPVTERPHSGGEGTPTEPLPELVA